MSWSEGLKRYIARSWEACSNGLLVAQAETVGAEKPCAILEELRLSAEVLKHLLINHHIEPQAHYNDAVWVG